MADKPTIIVTKRGGIAPGTSSVSYRRGFADLLDFTTRPTKVVVLPPGAPIKIGITRTGHALRDAMAAFERTKP